MSFNKVTHIAAMPKVRRWFLKPHRPFEERNRMTLNLHKDKRLKLGIRSPHPGQFSVPPMEPDPEIVTKERKLPSLSESLPPYRKYSQETIDSIQKFETYYDPLFNPHLLEERHKVNPDEEPFNAIYADSKSESSNQYTKVRNITTTELWDYVERLAKIKIAPRPEPRKPNEPIKPMASGYVPPPEVPPDLPYFIARTRNHILPVYYFLDSNPEKCHTIVKQVTGDLWQLEKDLRAHLETVTNSKRRILTSVQETDERILFRGRYIHEIVDWLHAQGF